MPAADARGHRPRVRGRAPAERAGALPRRSPRLAASRGVAGRVRAAVGRVTPHRRADCRRRRHLLRLAGAPPPDGRRRAAAALGRGHRVRRHRHLHRLPNRTARARGRHSMIKAVIFDMDGVLVDADKWHFNALNVALQHSDVDQISWQEHLTVYKGIPTRSKLEILTARKGLSPELWDKIHASNQDVERAKPHPEIYLKAFELLVLAPDECVIVEDSDVGKAAAAAAGGVLCSVNDPADVNYYRVMRTLREADRLNVVIPAAGQGKRFAEVGYQHPKPLIDVEGRPMIAWVLENFAGVGRPIVVMQQRHIEQYCADFHVRELAADAEIVPVHGMTEGAACTVLLAEQLIDNGSELVLANSDQYVDVDVAGFVQRMRDRGADGGILTFRDDHPKWSYARTDADGRVIEVAEKVVISDQATVGIYYFRRGADFVAAARRMIEKDARVNGEFYVCPVFNELIAAGATVYVDEIEKSSMHGLGTPEDLEAFLAARRRGALRTAA